MAARDSATVSASEFDARATPTRIPRGSARRPTAATCSSPRISPTRWRSWTSQAGTVVQRLATERYPYDVVVDAHGTVYVSAWGGNTVSTFTTAPGGLLRDTGRIPVARHPSALLLSGDGSRLFVASGSTDHVAVVDTKARRVVARLLDPPPAGPGEGSTPNALALSSDGTRLFVAEADANSIAVFDLSPAASGVAAASGDDKLAGRIPAGWYPSSLLVVGDQLEVASGKGRGSVPNPRGPNPQIGRTDEYSLNTIAGAVMRVPLVGDERRRARAIHGARGVGQRMDAGQRAVELSAVRARDLHRQGKPHLRSGVRRRRAGRRGYEPRVLPPSHLGEPSLARRPVRAVRPLLRERRSEPRRPQLVDGRVRDRLSREDGAVPLLGARPLVRLRGHEPRRAFPTTTSPSRRAATCGTSRRRRASRYRNYGEFVVPSRNASPDDLPPGYRGNKPFLRAHTNPRVPRVRPRDQGPASRRRLDRRAEAVFGERIDADARDGASAERPHLRRDGGQALAARRLRRQRSRAGAHDRGAVASLRSGRTRSCSCSRTTRRTVRITSTSTDRRCSSSRPTTGAGRSIASPTRRTCCARSRRSSGSNRCRSSTISAARCATSGRTRRTCVRTRRSRPPSRSTR